MKTIFDKVDPKYIECTTGACEHITHNHNTVLLPVLVVLLFVYSYKFIHGKL